MDLRFRIIADPGFRKDRYGQLKAARQDDRLLLIYFNTTAIQNSTTIPKIYSFFSDNQAVFFHDTLLRPSFFTLGRKNSGQFPGRFPEDLPFCLGGPDANTAIGIARDQNLPGLHRLSCST